MLLEGDAEKTYNQHSAATDKMQALKDTWRDLKDNFSYQEQTPLVNVDERSASPFVHPARPLLL